MLIPIVGPSTYSESGSDDDRNDNSVPEWAMLELNGEVLPPLASKEEIDHAKEQYPWNMVEFGSVRMNKGFPTLVIGSHELRGKIEKLNKPMAILKKVDSRQDDNTSKKVHYEISGVITQKVLFNEFPKSILR